MTLKRLGRAAGELLLRLVEQEPSVILQATLDEFEAAAGRELVAAGALVSDGIARSVTFFDDDAPRNVDLVWLDQSGAYGYFSAADGFVIPDPKSLQLYRVDHGWWLNWMTRELDLQKSGKPIELVAGRASEIGELRISPRLRVPVIFVRAVRAATIAGQFSQALLARYEGRPSLVLTSARPQYKPVNLPSGVLWKSCWSIVTAEIQHFAFDREVVSAGWMITVATKANAIFELSPDGRTAVVNGETLHLRGRVHQSIVKRLYHAHLAGRKTPTTDILSEAAPSVDTISKAFHNSKHWPHLKRIVRTEQGLSWLDI
jgi:hypothetical protein